MHLVVLAEEFYPNTSGGGLARWQFCQKAVERGHDVTVFTPREAGLPAAETVDGVDVRRPARVRPERAPPYSALGIVGRVLFSMRLLASLVVWFRGRDVDGVHSSGYALHWVGKVLSGLYGVAFVPFVSYTPSTEGDWRPTPRFLLERLNFRLCMGDAVLCRDPDVRAILERYVDGPVILLHGILQEPKVRAAAERADPEAVRERFGVAPDETFLAFVGRLVPVKEPTAAVSVVAELPAEYALVVVGDGPARPEVRAAVERHGLGDRVVLAGERSHDETLEIVAAADALVLTSRAESYFAVALEGLALGCHVFATPVGVLTDIDHRRLHVGRPETMAAEIRATAFDGPGGLDSDTLNRYSMDRYADEVFDAFERVSRRDGGS